METIWNIGITWNIFFQNLGIYLKTPMEVFSFFGTEIFFLLLLPALYWCIDSAVGLRVGIILLLSSSVNNAFKILLHGPRPYWYSTDVIGYSNETSFGVPSGHAQIAFGVWGMMAASIGKWWGWLIAILIIMLIGISRLYLGVHFPHDVILGWLIGALLLWLLLRFWETVAAWLKNMSLGKQILASFLGSLILILFPLISSFWLITTNWQPPQAWAVYAKDAVSFSFTFSTAGTFFGLLTGMAWFNHHGGFDVRGPLWQRLLRYILGFLGLLVFYLGVKVIFGLIAPNTESVLASILRYIRYFLIGAWISAGAPWIFVKLKLAQKAT